MGAGEVLKSYLVSLGYDVDMTSYQKFDRTLKDAAHKVEGHTNGMGLAYVKAATIITSALASVGFATIGLLDKISGADLEYQKFAMHMLMGKDAAMRMKVATDALGESIEDIAWNPELRERYFALTRQARGMEQPKDAAAQLRYLRDIRFEFTRMKVEATYGMQWVGYYLFKYLAGPIQNVREGLGKLNDWIQSNMPSWSEKIARWMTIIINIGRSAWRTIMNIWDGLKGMWDMLPGWAKGVAALLAVAFAPISPALKVIGGLLLLMEDFYGYIDGRKSSKTLAPIWDTLVMAADTAVRSIVALMVLLDELYEKMSGNSDKSLGEIWDSVKEAYSTVEGTVNVIAKPVAKGTSIWSNPTEKNDKRSGVSKFLAKAADKDAALMSSLLSSSGVSSSTSNTNVKVDVGGVNVTVTQPGASAKDVHQAVTKAIEDKFDMKAALRNREFKGVY
jgi:hypothetical protein